jgi:hypothetical protein
MPSCDSSEIGTRIEALYGAPLPDLREWARTQPPGMLSALLFMHTRLADAERTIAGARERLSELVISEGPLDTPRATKTLVWTRRLADAVTTRDVLVPSLTQVLGSLRAAPPASPSSPASPAPSPPLPAIPAPAGALTPHTAARSSSH